MEELAEPSRKDRLMASRSARFLCMICKGTICLQNVSEQSNLAVEILNVLGTCYCPLSNPLATADAVLMPYSDVFENSYSDDFEKS